MLCKLIIFCAIYYLYCRKFPPFWLIGPGSDVSRELIWRLPTAAAMTKEREKLSAAQHESLNRVSIWPCPVVDNDKMRIVIVESPPSRAPCCLGQNSHSDSALLLRMTEEGEGKIRIMLTDGETWKPSKFQNLGQIWIGLDDLGQTMSEEVFLYEIWCGTLHFGCFMNNDFPLFCSVGILLQTACSSQMSDFPPFTGRPSIYSFFEQDFFLERENSYGHFCAEDG